MDVELEGWSVGSLGRKRQSAPQSISPLLLFPTFPGSYHVDMDLLNLRQIFGPKIPQLIFCCQTSEDMNTLVS